MDRVVNSCFLKTIGRTWEKPLCKITIKLPFIPTEQEIDSLIAGCGKKLGTFLLLLKETAMRKGEAFRLLWKDIDLERRTITLNNPEKFGKARMFKVSNELIARINNLPRKNQKVFGTSNRKTSFYDSRKRIAHKLQNLRLMNIGFHTLRHWKATMLYHQTKDVLYVMNILGHKKLDTTYYYIRIYNQIYKPQQPNQFITKIASTKEERIELRNNGWTFWEKDGDDWYFSKPKLD